MQIALAIIAALSISVFACFLLSSFILLFVPFLHSENGDATVLNHAGEIVVLAAFIVLLVVIFLAIAKDKTLAKDFEKWRH